MKRASRCKQAEELQGAVGRGFLEGWSRRLCRGGAAAAALVLRRRSAKRSAWTPPANSLLPMILKKLAMAMPILLKKCGLSGFMDGSWYLPPQRLGDRLQDPACSPRAGGIRRPVRRRCLPLAWMSPSSRRGRSTASGRPVRRAGGALASVDGVLVGVAARGDHQAVADEGVGVADQHRGQHADVASAMRSRVVNSMRCLGR
jgi:hypothetical protein